MSKLLHFSATPRFSFAEVIFSLPLPFRGGKNKSNLVPRLDRGAAEVDELIDKLGNLSRNRRIERSFVGFFFRRKIL